jgi:hypothetical protein
MPGPRPGGATLVSILAWISGLLQVIGGVLVLIAGGAISALVVAAWITIALGVVTILVGIGLWRGSSAARIIATIVFALSLVNAVVGIFAAPENPWQEVVSALLALIGLILLWTKAANDFFRR